MDRNHPDHNPDDPNNWPDDMTYQIPTAGHNRCGWCGSPMVDDSEIGMGHHYACGSQAIESPALTIADLDAAWCDAYYATYERMWPPVPLTGGPLHQEVLDAARQAGIRAVLERVAQEAERIEGQSGYELGHPDAEFYGIADWLRGIGGEV